jgi:hypothetical protein
VIKTFADRDAERLIRREPVERLGTALQRVGLRKLRMLKWRVSPGEDEGWIARFIEANPRLFGRSE